MIVHILAAEKIVNVGPPIAAVAGRTAIVDVKDDITFLRQQLVEHKLAVIIVPAVDRILKIAGTVDEDGHRIFLFRVKAGRQIVFRRDLFAVTRRNIHEMRVIPFAGRKRGGNRIGQTGDRLALLTVGTDLLRIQIVGRIPLRKAIDQCRNGVDLIHLRTGLHALFGGGEAPAFALGGLVDIELPFVGRLFGR